MQKCCSSIYSTSTTSTLHLEILIHSYSIIPDLASCNPYHTKRALGRICVHLTTISGAISHSRILPHGFMGSIIPKTIYKQLFSSHLWDNMNLLSPYKAYKMGNKHKILIHRVHCHHGLCTASMQI